jgi:nicotinamidase-related amidase
MSEPIWNQFLTERDKAVFSAAGYGARAGFGKRPALLVIDVSYAFTGDKPGEPILDSIKRWRNSCGAESWVAVGHIKKLIDKAHQKQLPVIYTTGVRRPDLWDSGGWTRKNTRSMEAPKTASNRNGYDIVDEIGRARRTSLSPSRSCRFFGTPMTGYLTQLQCDSVVVTGTTTSGCVRATVVDAFSYNYRVAMVEEGCFDRSQASHAMTLCDLGAKYADIVKTDEVLSYFDTLETGMFDLPRGIPA